MMVIAYKFMRVGCVCSLHILRQMIASGTRVPFSLQGYAPQPPLATPHESATSSTGQSDFPNMVSGPGFDAPFRSRPVQRFHETAIE